MHLPTNWNDRLVAENGQIWRLVTAEWTDKRSGKAYWVDCYKENDAGEAWEQNLYCSMYGGYCVAFPGLPRNKNYNSWYYDTSIADEEGWSYCNPRNVGWTFPASTEEIELVCSFYPDFKYVIKKYKFQSRAELLEKLQVWIEHPELELFLASGFGQIGMNGNFWRMTEKNRKEVCLFIRQNPQFNKLSLREIRQAMKADSPMDYAAYLSEVPSYHRSTNARAYYPCISYIDWKYLKKQTKKRLLEPDHLSEDIIFCQVMNLYEDYMRMLYRSDHDSHDEYWLHPSDLKTAHDRLVEEERVKEEARRLQEELKKKKEAAERWEAVQKIEKKFKELNGDVDGYSIFVTADYDEWQRQAKALHQCICAAGYYQKVADGKCTIVFIQKDNLPVATAEVFPDGHVGQFYSDEVDRNNCLPSDEVKAAFEKWKSSVPASKFKPRKQRAKKEAVA